MNNKRFILISVILMLFIISISSVNAGDLNTTEDLTINEELAIDNGDSINIDEINEEFINDINNDLNNDGNIVSIDSIDELEDTNFENVEQLDNNKKSSVLSDSNSITVTDKTFLGIQSAINGASDGDTIILDGYYAYDGGDIDYIYVDKQLTFLGIGNTVIDGDGYGIFSTYENLTEVIFNNITFQHFDCAINALCNVTVSSCNFVYDYSSYADAIYCNFCNLTIFNCSFVNCSNGVINDGNSTIFNCSFVNCSDTAIYSGGDSTIFNCSFVNGGGAIYSQEDLFVSNCSFVNCSNNAIISGGDSTIFNCSFVNNYGHSSIGGAIYSQEDLFVSNCSFVNCSYAAIYSKGDLTIFNSSFVGNTGGQGGASAIDARNGVLVNCSFVNEDSPSSGGTVIFLSNGSIRDCSFLNITSGGSIISIEDDYEDICNYTIHNSSFENNSAYTVIYCGGSKNSLTVSNCSFVNNSRNSSFVNNSARDNGGAISCYADNLTIINCSFVNNSAQTNGGAIYSQADLFVSNCSFVNNSATVYGGGAISFYGDAEFYNCTCENNTARYYPNSQPVLKLENLTYFLGDEGILNAYLYDVAGPIANGKITFNINGVEYNRTTNGKGLASLNVANIFTETGIYEVSITFKDDYSSISKNVSVVIDKDTPNLTVNNLAVVIGDNAILKANLSNHNGPLSGKTIVFSINGLNVTKSVSSGITTLDLKPYLSDLGEYVVEVYFEGDEFNNPVSTSAIVSVNSYLATLSINQIGNYYNDSVLRFYLINNKTNLGISGADIQLVFSNGNTSILTTDSDGIATYDIPFNPGNYSLNASVINSEGYINNVTLNNLEIKSRTGIIEISQNNTGYDEAALFIKLYNDATGDVYKNVKVNLDFVNLDISVEVLTNEEGIAIYDIPFNVGTYYVLVSVNEEYSEFNDVEKDDIVITKSDALIFFENDIAFAVGDSGSTNFTVVGGSVDVSNIHVVDHPEVVIGLVGNIITVSSLDIGNYTLEVVIDPDSNHNSNSCHANIIVFDPIPSFVVFDDDIRFDYGESGSANFTVVGGSVDVSNISVVDHPEAIISLSDNIVTVSNLSAGNYGLKIITTPDFMYKSSISLVEIVVNKIDSGIKFTNDLIFDYGSSDSAILILEGCTVNQEDISVVDSMGILCEDAIIKLNRNIVTVSNLAAGNYYLKVITSPDSNHNSVTNNGNILVNKIPSTIDFTNISFEYGSIGSVNLILSGCTVNEENIRFVGDNGVDFTDLISLENNIVFISNLEIGNYYLIVTTTPDGNHSAVTENETISVTKITPNIIFNNNLTFDYGNVGILNLSVGGATLNSSSFSIQGQNASFELEKVGEDYLVYISNLPIGVYALNVTTISDSFYSSVSKSCTVTVQENNGTAVKTNTSVSFGSKSMKFAYGGSGSVTVAVGGGTLNVKNIEVVGHKEAVKKYSNGKITISNLTVGTYTLRVTPTPDANHIAKTQNITITVTKITANITAKAINVYYKNTKKWSIKLMDTSNKKVLANKQVVLKVYTGKKYATYKVKTNSKGIATFNVPKTLKLGTHKVVLSYSAKFTTCKAVSSKIIIKKRALTINIGYQKFEDGSRTVDIIVKDKASKKALNKIKVKILIYTGNKVTKTYTKLVTAYYKFKKENGFAMYGGGIKAFGKAGTHKIKVLPNDVRYSGSSNVIKFSVPKTAKSKTVVVSNGKYGTVK